MVLEYLNNIYILPLVAVVIGLCIVYIYDFFEKKQYTSSHYLRLAILIYISCIGTIYISKTYLLAPIQSGGSQMPQPNEILKTHFEQFKTGVPTF